MHLHCPSCPYSSNNFGLHDHTSGASQPLNHLAIFPGLLLGLTRVDINASRVHLELTSMTTNFPTRQHPYSTCDQFSSCFSPPLTSMEKGNSLWGCSPCLHASDISLLIFLLSIARVTPPLIVSSLKRVIPLTSCLPLYSCF
jgi:hypothetical protein